MFLAADRGAMSTLLPANVVFLHDYIGKDGAAQFSKTKGFSLALLFDRQRPQRTWRTPAPL
jgi:hypothetical protein